MINAAEPVDFEAIMKFYEIFTQYGLPPNVVFPTYGLAEHTVFVCSGGLQALTVSKEALEKGQVEIVKEEELAFDHTKITGDLRSDDHHKIVGCGFPFRGDQVKVIIVDPEKETNQTELTVGEVWVTSPSKALGYWGNMELSKHDFAAVVQPSNNSSHESKEELSGEYLRTGDLGFLYKGELFICGRIKDLIIVGGSNHYPQDIEHSIELQVGEYLRAGCSAAFSLKSETSHTEDIAYVAEVSFFANFLWNRLMSLMQLKDGVSSSKFEDIVRLCRECSANEHGVGLAVVCLLQTRSVPKTTSGKIARSWCKRGLSEGTLQILYRSDKKIGELELSTNEPGKPSMKGLNNQNDAIRSADNAPQNHIIDTDISHSTQTAEELRQLSLLEIGNRLEQTLIQISSVGPTKLSAPLDRTLPLIAMGLDSMTVVQFKGVIENRY